MLLENNKSLIKLNTFAVNCYAENFICIKKEENIKQSIEFIKREKKKYFVLGGGSNILLTKNIEGLVLHNKLEGIHIIGEDSDSLTISVRSGVIWNDLVNWTIEKKLWGIENLILIPGTVGAAPIQNIGAYGVEIKDVFEYLDAVHIETGEVKRFYKTDCAFGYRESVFKRKLKGKYIICHVAYRLNKNNHLLNTSYGAIETELKNNNIERPTIRDVSNAVIAIRQSKLPDPNKIGNAGSFFKNPVVPQKTLQVLLETHPNIPHYPAPNNEAKLAAGWLIEQAGWKGKTFEGRFGVHKKQALVLVNYNNAKGKEILSLSDQIIADVASKFDVSLEREVNIL